MTSFQNISMGQRFYVFKYHSLVFIQGTIVQLQMYLLINISLQLLRDDINSSCIEFSGQVIPFHLYIFKIETNFLSFRRIWIILR
ncbi:Ribonucleoside-diphosphate reductase large subunit [Frankliniella fusca]|uniref:Ribonucleoside-diphosphate reductase large subunit n=1 Tax=Frankliniella fusca TaxID=407009 RepID=A0AAE1LBU3_9NEOP|nr:Ribonucleoside-diphosphate reductase large subunit [Frankliniella fusca]